MTTTLTALAQAPAEAPAATRPIRWYIPLAVMVAISLALVLASYLLPTHHPIYTREGAIGFWLNVDTERNLPSWWSTMLLGAGGILHLGGGWIARRTGARGVPAWVLVGVLLLALSLDEAISIHETLAELRGVIATPFDFEYFWLVIGVPLAVVILLVVVLSGLRMPAHSLAMLLLGFLLLFGGAVGVEAIESAQFEQGRDADVTLSYHREEALEMVGASVIAVAPLAGLRVSQGGATLTLAPRLGERRRSRRAARRRAAR